MIVDTVLPDIVKALESEAYARSAPALEVILNDFAWFKFREFSPEWAAEVESKLKALGWHAIIDWPEDLDWPEGMKTADNYDAVTLVAAYGARPYDRVARTLPQPEVTINLGPTAYWFFGGLVLGSVIGSALMYILHFIL